MTAPDLARLVTAFFVRLLAVEHNASPHTTKAYRDAVKLLLRFAADTCHRPMAALQIDDLTPDLILRFLTDLETTRHNSVRTRNARLAAIHSFFWYVLDGHPECALACHRVLAIPVKKATLPLLGYLTEAESKGVVHNHKEMVAFLEKELRSIGVEVEVVGPAKPFEVPYHRCLAVKYPGDPADVPVVVGRLRGKAGKPVLGLETLYNNLVIGDRSQGTVDPLGGEIKDGKVYGRGATNSRTTVAKYIEVLRVLKESGVALDGDLVVTLTPGEGATEFAMPWVVEHRPELVKADWCLMGCCGPVFQRQAGHIWAKLSVLGTMHHPGSAEVYAVHQMLQVLPKVIDVDRWMKWKPDPMFSKPHVEATVLSSGNPRDVAVNVTPATVEAQLGIRLLPSQDPKQVVAEINKLLDDLKKNGSPTSKCG